jgi:Astacin (Peptidase family M12A)
MEQQGLRTQQRLILLCAGLKLVVTFGFLTRSTRIRCTVSFLDKFASFGLNVHASIANVLKNFIWRDLRTLEKKTCVRFIVRTNQLNYIRIFNGTGCYSNLGLTGGEQDISLMYPGCINNGTPVHEFMHALGLAHMQSHVDRDDFLTINWQNMEKIYESQFDKVNSTVFSNYGTPYDYWSVMHYGRKDFSKNGLDVMVPKDISYIDVIGQNFISQGDIDRVNRMYEC